MEWNLRRLIRKFHVLWIKIFFFMFCLLSWKLKGIRDIFSSERIFEFFLKKYFSKKKLFNISSSQNLNLYSLEDFLKEFSTTLEINFWWQITTCLIKFLINHKINTTNNLTRTWVCGSKIPAWFYQQEALLERIKAIISSLCRGGRWKLLMTFSSLFRGFSLCVLWRACHDKRKSR
jgi:hypothetical protein